MPPELEVVLLCEDFHTTPGHFGYDELDPRVWRRFRLVKSVHQAAESRRAAKNHGEWEKTHRAAARMLKWVEGESYERPLEPMEVRVSLPQRPKP